MHMDLHVKLLEIYEEDDDWNLISNRCLLQSKTIRKIALYYCREIWPDLTEVASLI